MELAYLIIYAVITVLLTIRAFYKKYNYIYSFVWAAYAVSAVFCVLCKLYQPTLVGVGSYHNYWYDLSDTTWWGYVLIIICNVIAFEPFKNFNKKDILKEFGTKRGTINYFSTFCYIYIVLAIIFIIPSIQNIVSTMNVIDLGALRSSLYANAENEGSVVIASNAISNICFKLCLLMKYLAVFICFGMIKQKNKPYLSLIVLGLNFFLVFLNSKATAARGGMLIFLFAMFLIGMCFYKYLSAANKRKVVILGSVVGIIVFFFIFAVTVSRFQNDGGGGNPILRNVCFYLGHGPIEFSKVTGNLTDFAYGKTIIGRLISHYFGTDYSWTTIADSIGYPNIGALFVTYLGFLYTDFGAVGCLLFTTVWSRVMCKILKKRPNNISTIYFFLYYLSFYVTGVFVVGRLEYAALVTASVIYFIMRLVERDPKIRSIFTRRIRLRW